MKKLYYNRKTDTFTIKEVSDCSPSQVFLIVMRALTIGLCLYIITQYLIGG